MLTNTQTSYGTVARALHWAVALLLITTFTLGFVGGKISATADTVGLLQTLYSVHKTIGITVLGLAVLRVVWMFTQPRPVPLHPERSLETLAGEVVHWALYVALFVMPVSGWVRHASEAGFAPILWPFGQELPFVPKSEVVAHAAGAVHGLSAYVIFATIGLHVVGALKHAFVDRDDTVTRMTRGTNAGQVGVHGALPKVIAPMIASGVWGVTLAISLTLAGADGAEHTSHAEHGHAERRDTEQEHTEHAHADTASTAHEGAEHEETEHEETEHVHADDERDAVANAQTDGSQWTVTDGGLTISVLQMGADITGQFATWTADITYDEATGSGAVEVIIDTTSLTLGSVTQETLGPEFFNAETFATAEFKGDITRIEDRTHVVEASLTLVGQTVPVELSFTLDVEGDVAVVSGTTQLDRRDYGMGAGYEGEGTVGYAVQVQIELTAQRTQ